MNEYAHEHIHCNTNYIILPNMICVTISMRQTCTYIITYVYIYLRTFVCMHICSKVNNMYASIQIQHIYTRGSGKENQILA